MSQFVGQNRDGTYGEKFDWSKGEKVDWKKLATSPFFTGSTYQQVLCKDGTTRTQENNPNARIMDACRDNGGRAENQTISVKQISEEVKLENSKIGNKTLSTEEKFYESLGIKSEGGYDWTIKAKGRLLVLVALVGSYFAYKKFIK